MCKRVCLCVYTTLSHIIFDTPSFTPLCHTPSLTHRHRPSFTHHFCSPSFTTPFFTHRFVTHHLSPHHLSLSHTIFHIQLGHTHTTLFYFAILHHLLCLSFLPGSRYNIWCSLLEEVALWGYPVLELGTHTHYQIPNPCECLGCFVRRQCAVTRCFRLIDDA